MERKVFYTKNKEGVTFRVPISVDDKQVYYNCVCINKNLKLETSKLINISVDEFKLLINTSLIIPKKEYLLILKELDKTHTLINTIKDLFSEFLNRKLDEKIS